MRNVFISGINRGLGRALATRFLAAGDVVVGTATRGDVDCLHENLTALLLDFSRQDTVDRCLEQVRGLDRSFDVLINNAGVLRDQDETRVILEKLKETLEVNLFGHIQITEALIPLIPVGGHIINISSSAGSLEETARANYPSYKISKAALNMYTRTLAIRLAGKVTVSSVHPGWIKTDMGGEDADFTPQAAAEDIFKLAGSNTESGQFWFRGEKFPW